MFICACVTVSTFPSNKLFHFIWGDTPSHMEVTSRLQQRRAEWESDKMTGDTKKNIYDKKKHHTNTHQVSIIDIQASTLRKMVKQIETAFLVCLMMPFSNRHISALLFTTEVEHFLFQIFFSLFHFLLFLLQREAFVLKLKIKSRCEIFKNWSVVSTIVTNWNWNQF